MSKQHEGIAEVFNGPHGAHMIIRKGKRRYSVLRPVEGILDGETVTFCIEHRPGWLVAVNVKRVSR